MYTRRRAEFLYSRTVRARHVNFILSWRWEGIAQKFALPHTQRRRAQRLRASFYVRIAILFHRAFRVFYGRLRVTTEIVWPGDGL